MRRFLKRLWEVMRGKEYLDMDFEKSDLSDEEREKMAKGMKFPRI